MMLSTVLLATALLRPAAPEFAWVEGEAPISESAPLSRFGPSYPQLLSGGQWANWGKTKAETPGGELLVKYRLESPFAGRANGWARVGYEFVRSPFEWRLNGGPWVRKEPTEVTRGVVRLATWMEAGWLSLGEAELKAGANELEFRVTEEGANKSLIFALDAATFVKGDWKPIGARKPGEVADTAIDREARAKTFRLPAEGERPSLRLDGAWEIARWDDPTPDVDPFRIRPDLPSDLDYEGITVPGNAWNKPEMIFGSQLVYRTRVEIPKSLDGRGFRLNFAGTNFVAGVFVNGTFVKQHRSVLVPWSVDVSRWVKPGEVNTLQVVVRGPYYAVDPQGKPDGVLKTRNMPNEQGFIQYLRWLAPIYPSSKGEGDGTAVGLVNGVRLTATGRVSVEDAFVKTSVRQKRLDAEITLENPDVARSVEVASEVVDPANGQVVLELPKQRVDLPAEGTKTITLGAGWANPELWWPVPGAKMYTLRTRVTGDGPADVHRQPFGFREVTTDGIKIRINGVARNFWNWVEVSDAGSSLDEYLANHRKEGNRFVRLSHDGVLARYLPAREDQLAWADRNGFASRLSTSIDGMFITYDLNNPKVWEGFEEHLVQSARAWRNHPSVIVVSSENELLYINAQNLGLSDMAEPKLRKAIDAAMKVDPTRPYMADGGDTLVAPLPVLCHHYPETAGRTLPENAYTLAQLADHSKRWGWDRKRPMMAGETFFYAGKLEDQAWIGGDDVFRGRAEADLGAAKYARLLIEGYRWAGVAGIMPWVGLNRVPGADKSFSDLAVFPRKRAHRITGGVPATVRVKVFNDTLSAEPVTLRWQFTVGGKTAVEGTRTMAIEPGFGEELDLRLNGPAVAKRTVGELRLAVLQAGKVGFEEALPVSILPVAKLSGAEGAFWLYDPAGSYLAKVKALGLTATRVTTPEALAGKQGTVLVAPNALTAETATSSAFMAFANAGGRVIVLEQEHVLSGLALPTTLRPTLTGGGYAFGQAPSSPLFADLGPSDLTDWAGDFPTFKRAYAKPVGGARSLVQAGDGLERSALLEVPTGRGVIVLCQMRAGEKLGVEPAAGILLRNLLRSYSGFRPSVGRMAMVADPASGFGQALERTGLFRDRAGLDQALGGKDAVVAVEATPARMKELVAKRAALSKFAQAGGWVMLNGVGRDSVADLSALTGIQEMMRPFRVERVTLESPNHPIAATLGNRDFSFTSPQEIMFGDLWVSEHVYSLVVPGSDVAPFAKMPDGPEDPFVYKPTFDDHDPYNYVNGLLNADSWRTIRQLWVPETGELKLEFRLRRPETLRELQIWNNVNYNTIKDLEIRFDDDPGKVRNVVLPPDSTRVRIPLDPPVPTNRTVTLTVKSWRGEFQIRDNRPLRLVGIDDLRFLRSVGAEEARRKVVIDNVGGLVVYPMGKGGIVLNQLKFDDADPNPVNLEKKTRLLTVLLKNLCVGAGTSSVGIAGVNLDLAPVDITRWCNRYHRSRPDQSAAWGDGVELTNLTVGERVAAGVPFALPSYVNAPIPQAIGVGEGLAGEVKGIEVGRKADQLYLLQSARVTRPVQGWEQGDRNFKAPELVRMVVHYADGSREEVPIRLGEETAHYADADSVLPSASQGFSIPLQTWDGGPKNAKFFVTLWRNPRPSSVIRAIDFVRGAQGDRGSVLVLGVTAGTIRGSTNSGRG